MTTIPLFVPATTQTLFYEGDYLDRRFFRTVRRGLTPVTTTLMFASATG